MRKSCLDWLFARQPDRWISILRIGLGLQLLLYLFSIRADWTAFLDSNGYRLSFRTVSETMLSSDSRLAPRLGWLIDLTSPIQVNEIAVLWSAWLLLLVAALLLIAGLFSREATIGAWLLQVSVTKSAGLFVYGVDNFTTIGLFYLMLSPMPDSLSLDLGSVSGPAARAVSFGASSSCISALFIFLAV